MGNQANWYRGNWLLRLSCWLCVYDCLWILPLSTLQTWSVVPRSTGVVGELYVYDSRTFFLSIVRPLSLERIRVGFFCLGTKTTSKKINAFG